VEQLAVAVPRRQPGKFPPEYRHPSVGFRVALYPENDFFP